MALSCSTSTVLAGNRRVERQGSLSGPRPHPRASAGWQGFSGAFCCSGAGGGPTARCSLFWCGCGRECKVLSVWVDREEGTSVPYGLLGNQITVGFGTCSTCSPGPFLPLLWVWGDWRVCSDLRRSRWLESAVAPFHMKLFSDAALFQKMVAFIFFLKSQLNGREKYRLYFL